MEREIKMLSENKKKLLTEFIATQFFKNPNEEPYLKDECPCVGYYPQTLADVGMTKKEMQVEMIEMRNDGLVEIKMCIDYDGIPHGSGYFLTEKGLKYVQDYFSNEELDKLI